MQITQNVMKYILPINILITNKTECNIIHSTNKHTNKTESDGIHFACKHTIKTKRYRMHPANIHANNTECDKNKHSVNIQSK